MGRLVNCHVVVNQLLLLHVLRVLVKRFLLIVLMSTELFDRGEHLNEVNVHNSISICINVNVNVHHSISIRFA